MGGRGRKQQRKGRKLAVLKFSIMLDVIILNLKWIVQSKFKCYKCNQFYGYKRSHFPIYLYFPGFHSLIFMPAYKAIKAFPFPHSGFMNLLSLTYKLLIAVINEHWIIILAETLCHTKLFICLVWGEQMPPCLCVCVFHFVVVTVTIWQRHFSLRRIHRPGAT